MKSTKLHAPAFFNMPKSQNVILAPLIFYFLLIQSKKNLWNLAYFDKQFICLVKIQCQKTTQSYTVY